MVAERSTCARLNVGAIITLDNRIVSMGWNGQPPGVVHCEGHNCAHYHIPGSCGVIHAEDNAIRRLVDGPGELAMYVTDSPCPRCAQLILDAGITTLYFARAYRDQSPMEHLHHAGIALFQVMPAGFVRDWSTGEIQ